MIFFFSMVPSGHPAIRTCTKYLFPKVNNLLFPKVNNLRPSPTGCTLVPGLGTPHLTMLMIFFFIMGWLMSGLGTWGPGSDDVFQNSCSPR